MTRARKVPKLICAAQTNPEAFFIGLLTAFVASHKQVERCSGGDVGVVADRRSIGWREAWVRRHEWLAAGGKPEYGGSLSSVRDGAYLSVNRSTRSSWRPRYLGETAARVLRAS